MNYTTEELLESLQNDLDNIKTHLSEGGMEISAEDTFSDIATKTTGVVIGGGTPTITNLLELNTNIMDLFQSWEDYLLNVKENYEVYINEPVILYSPEGYQNYLIHKRSNGRYRIIWSYVYNLAYFQNASTIYFGGLKTNQVFDTNFAYNVDDIKNRIFNMSLQQPIVASTENPNPRQFYYSNEFASIDDLITAITSPTGNIVYTKFTDGYGFGGVEDSPNIIPVTNMNIIDVEDNYKVLNSKRISQNETILSR